MSFTSLFNFLVQIYKANRTQILFIQIQFTITREKENKINYTMYYSGTDHPHRSDSDQHLRHRQHVTCSQGHTSSLILQTLEGGSICLVCLSNLISNPNSPTVHVSYALSQLSHAISQPQFLHNLLTFHPHFLVSPLVTAISSFDDEPLAKQMIDVINELIRNGDCSVYGEFVARVSDRLCSGSLSWSRRQVYMVIVSVVLDFLVFDNLEF